MTTHKTAPANPTPAAAKATSAAPEKPATPEKAVPAAPPVPKKGLVFPLLVTVAAIFPIAIGIGVVRAKASTSKPKPPAVTVQTDQNECQPPPVYLTTDRRAGDDHFLHRRYEIAMRHYQSLGSTEVDRLPEGLRYRCALCLEGLGLWNEALVQQRAIAEAAEQPVMKAAAIFAQARLWLRQNETATAQTLFRSLILRPDLQRGVPENMIREVAFVVPLLKADAATAQVRQSNRIQPAQVNELLNQPMETALAWADLFDPEDTSPADAEAPDNSLVIRRRLLDPKSDNRLEFQTVDICCREQPLGKIVEKLAEEFDWTLDITNLADPHCMERVVSLTENEIPVCLLLTLISCETQSTWNVADNELVIDGFDPSGDSGRHMVARTLISLINRSPNDRLVPYSRFALAEIAQSEGYISEAASMFVSLTKPGSTTLAIRAACCAGMNFVRLGDFESACSQFKRVVDSGPEFGVHPDASLMLAQLLLDRGEVQESIFQLRRLIDPSSPPAIQARAAILLGMSYLVQERYIEAGEVIFAKRTQYEEPAVRNAASFVTAWARWKSLTGELQEREASYLYRALLAMKPDSDWLGQTGQLLIGRAYSQLGFDDQMADLYSHMLTMGMTENIAGEMINALAEYNLDEGHRESAREMWWLLSSGPSKRLSNRARFRLAEMALLEARPKDCLEFCELTNVDEGVPRKEILKLMGRAFEMMGEDALAARCYSGQMVLP